MDGGFKFPVVEVTYVNPHCIISKWLQKSTTQKKHTHPWKCIIHKTSTSPLRSCQEVRSCQQDSYNPKYRGQDFVSQVLFQHEAVMTWKLFSALVSLYEGKHRSPVLSPHIGPVVMFSLLLVWSSCWTNSRVSNDQRRNDAHWTSLWICFEIWHLLPQFRCKDNCQNWKRYDNCRPQTCRFW